MRKTILTLSATALVAAPLTAVTSADAAGYRVSATVSERVVDITSSTASLRRTTIKGTVTGGSVKGKKVYFYAVNTDTASKARKYLGSYTMGSSGRFAKSYQPADGGKYTITVEKRSSGGSVQAKDTTSVSSFQFVNLARFFSSSASVAAVRADGSRNDAYNKIDGIYYSTQYRIAGGGKAVFTTGGFRCKKIFFKIGVADGSPDRTDGKVTFSQPGTTIVTRTMRAGDRAYEPDSKVRNSYRSSGSLTVAVAPSKDSVDPTAIQFILGNPKVFCTYPTRSTPAAK